MAVYFLILIGSALVAACLTKTVRSFATKFGLAVGPSSFRHVHKSPIPRLGGVAIFLTFLIGCAAYYFARQGGLVHATKNAVLLRMAFPAGLLFLVGLLDDLRGLSAKVKLIAQIGGGVSLYATGLRFVCIHSGSGNSLITTAFCLSLTVIWVVVVCNAVNLIDGLDGLAAGATLFSMATLFTFAVVDGRHGVALIIAVLAGANCGFLVFNFNPASIFLGDSGSLFIGFMLSGLVMSESQQQPNTLRVILVPVISLALPLTDLFLTVLRRFLSGHSLFGADREHIHHKLLEAGLTQRQVVCVLYGISATCAMLSLLFLYPSRFAWIPVVSLFALFIFFLVRKLGYQEFAEFGRLAVRVWQQKKIAAANIAIRKASCQLERTYNTAAIADVLEQSLRGDFNGFVIVLENEFVIAAEMDSAPTQTMERAWVLSPSQGLVLSMDLKSPRYGLIGRISLEHSVGQRLLVDSELLQTDLRIALGLALEHCLLTIPEGVQHQETENGQRV
jgi:UDP-GlcNAc:undecaprenyl-phosphate GlcNAc-1-phosphate transferase